VSKLGELIEAAERGVFPPADMGVSHVPQPTDKHAAVIGFTAHIIVAADVAPEWVATHLPPGDPGAAFNPPFLGALEQALNKRVNNIDAILVAPALAGPPGLDLAPVEDQNHPRVRRALRYRDDVRVWTTAGGVLTIGRGLAGRWETGFEVDPAHRGRGLGRALARAARHLTPDGRPMWAQVAVGNAASLRAVLAAGFVPVGEETLLVARRAD
jgi:GNAT superfamily N-acetyltransferase